MMTALDPKAVLENAARRTPAPLAHRVRGLSDRALAWLFITPTIALLLAINIFPLLWTIRLSFTNYRANRPNAAVLGVGIDNYVSVLTDPDVWAAMQATAHFLFWTILLLTHLRFRLAYLIYPRFRVQGGSTTELASITLKREAFEKWRTGYSSAFAIILFVTVFGLANIYVKALNRVKNR